MVLLLPLCLWRGLHIAWAIVFLVFGIVLDVQSLQESFNPSFVRNLAHLYLRCLLVVVLAVDTVLLELKFGFDHMEVADVGLGLVG